VASIKQSLIPIGLPSFLEGANWGQVIFIAIVLAQIHILWVRQSDSHGAKPKHLPRVTLATGRFVKRST
jgi:hypothetical protein